MFLIIIIISCKAPNSCAWLKWPWVVKPWNAFHMSCHSVNTNIMVNVFKYFTVNFLYQYFILTACKCFNCDKEYLCWGVWEITFTVTAFIPSLVILHHNCSESLKNTPETMLPTTILPRVMVGCMMRSSTSYAPASLLPCFPKAKKELNFFT